MFVATLCYDPTLILFLSALILLFSLFRVCGLSTVYTHQDCKVKEASHLQPQHNRPASFFSVSNSDSRKRAINLALVESLGTTTTLRYFTRSYTTYS